MVIVLLALLLGALIPNPWQIKVLFLVEIRFLHYCYFEVLTRTCTNTWKFLVALFLLKIIVFVEAQKFWEVSAAFVLWEATNVQVFR